MAGYVTQKRNLNRDFRFAYRRENVTHPFEDNGILCTYKSDQETFSYRSKGQADVDLSRALDTRTSYNPFTETNPNLVDPDGTLWDTGHEFFTRKNTERYSHENIFVKNANGNSWFRGPLFLGNIGEQPVAPSVPKLSLSDQKYWGAKAIAQSTPTKPLANTAVMIGELISDGLPITGRFLTHFVDSFDFATFNHALKREGIKAANWKDFLFRVGDSTLLAKFAVEPFISDLLSVMKAVSSAAQRIEQWKRDSGRQVRRSVVVNETNYTESHVLSGEPFVAGLSNFGWFPADQPLLQYPTQLIVSTVRNTKIVFSGAYMYYATVGETLLDRIVDYGRKADLILGLTPNMELLWELTPWSWLVDWQANVGDAISNATRFSADKLVLRYGYLQQETVQFNTYTPDRVVTFKDGQIFSPYRQLSVVQKERYKATPYGFGLDPNGFSASQWAILAALGLSKGGKKLP